MTETTETWGVISFYGLTGFRGVDDDVVGDVLTFPYQIGRFFNGAGTGHAFLNFHLYKKTSIVYDSGQKVEKVEDVIKDTHGFYPVKGGSATGLLTGMAGEFHEDSEMMGILERRAGTEKDYASHTHFVNTIAEWDAARSQYNIWKSKRFYQLMVKDCATYLLEVARAARLKVPVRNRVFNTLPYQAIRVLDQLNPQPPEQRKPISSEVKTTAEVN